VCVCTCAGSACVRACFCVCVASVPISSCPYPSLSLLFPNAFRVSRLEVRLFRWHVPEIGAVSSLCFFLGGRGFSFRERFHNWEGFSLYFTLGSMCVLRALGVLVCVCVCVCLLGLALLALGLFSRLSHSFLFRGCGWMLTFAVLGSFSISSS
jgi:hypothetical protein